MGKSDKNNRSMSQVKNRRQGCGGKMKSSFKSLDIYGEKVSLSYQGSDTYKTSPGAVVSLIVIGVVVAYAAYRAYILVNFINPDVSKKSFLRDLDETDPYRP